MEKQLSSIRQAGLATAILPWSTSILCDQSVPTRELDRAIVMIDRLLVRDELAGDEQDYLDVLSDLVEKYEDQRYPIERVSGVDALRHLVDSSGKTRATVAVEAGLPESTLSEVLSGRRRLNTRHISILARYFRINPGVFIDTPAESR